MILRRHSHLGAVSWSLLTAYSMQSEVICRCVQTKMHACKLPAVCNTACACAQSNILAHALSNIFGSQSTTTALAL